ncbi:unnamed protein product, partial [Allacma fusca]
KLNLTYYDSALTDVLSHRSIIRLEVGAISHLRKSSLKTSPKEESRTKGGYDLQESFKSFFTFFINI